MTIKIGHIFPLLFLLTLESSFGSHERRKGKYGQRRTYSCGNLASATWAPDPQYGTTYQVGQTARFRNLAKRVSSSLYPNPKQRREIIIEEGRKLNIPEAEIQAGLCAMAKSSADAKAYMASCRGIGEPPRDDSRRRSGSAGSGGGNISNEKISVSSVLDFLARLKT